MSEKQNVRDVQNRILEVMKYVDGLCRENGIEYFIMGGTALGAIRHGGFIPWDDDLDIFMKPAEYAKFKAVFEKMKSDLFILQEWRTTPQYLEYAKVRMNGTTFIEECYQDRIDMHHGIYIDIMILHKVPDWKFAQKLIYYESKFVTLYALSQRNWVPRNSVQRRMLKLLKILPCKIMAHQFYKSIYRYDDLTSGYKYGYWITPAKFKNGLFDACFFEKAINIPFEDVDLLASDHIKQYLTYRYGDYMKLPSKEAQKAAVHAKIFDTEKNYESYIKANKGRTN